MGGAPPLPLDFTPQGSKMRTFCTFFGLRQELKKGALSRFFGFRRNPRGPLSVYATPKVSRSPKAYPTQPCPLGRVVELSVWGRREKEAVGPRATLSADARAAREGGPGYPSDLQLPKPQVPCLEALEGVRIFPIPRFTRREAWALARHILVPAARRTKFDGPQFLARCYRLTSASRLATHQ